MKSTRGITLIALVVTIVVLLILAAVSISMLGGENGIITQAQNAKLETRAGEVEEKVNLWKNEKISSKYTNATVKTEDELLEEMKTDKILFEEEIDRENKIITIGTREISYKIDGETDVGKEALKFLVNSGEDGIVYMPIAKEEYGQYEIDWGDGTTGIDGTLTGNNGVKIASLDNTFVAATYEYPDAIEHTYMEKNKEYVVTITGNCDYINTHCVNCTPEKIIEVLQWGETGLEELRLEKCTSLRKIASPTENSFINIDNILYMFSDCTSLTTIPENLFANCPNVQKFANTFSGCTSLTTIPENLFANCPNAQEFDSVFSGCTGLTTIPENLFANCPNVQSFMFSFNDCTGLTTIPENLFANCPNVQRFSWIFAGCTSLTSIPTNLFEHCTNVKYFSNVFDGCTKLTGNAIPLWERVENGSSNDYVGTPDGEGCYNECEGLSNYYSIPEYWRTFNL